MQREDRKRGDETGREVMKQEERLLKRGRGEGIVQVFDETCTFFVHVAKTNVLFFWHMHKKKMKKKLFSQAFETHIFAF